MWRIKIIFNQRAAYLVDIVEEVAALDEEDVVDVGPRGALVQCQPLQTNVSRKVFVKHPRTCQHLIKL